LDEYSLARTKGSGEHDQIALAEQGPELTAEATGVVGRRELPGE